MAFMVPSSPNRSVSASAVEQNHRVVSDKILQIRAQPSPNYQILCQTMSHGTTSITYWCWELLEDPARLSFPTFSLHPVLRLLSHSGKLGKQLGVCNNSLQSLFPQRAD